MYSRSLHWGLPMLQEGSENVLKYGCKRRSLAYLRISAGTAYRERILEALCRKVNRLSKVSIDGSHGEDMYIFFCVENKPIFRDYDWIGVCVGYTIESRFHGC